MRPFALVFVLAAATVTAGTDAPTTVGAPLLGLKAVALADVLDKPEDGRVVRLSGTIENVCQAKGCWVALKQGDRQIHMTFAKYAFFVPKDAKGRPIVAEGRIVVKERPKAEIDHLKAEGAAESAGGKVSFEATGVEIAARPR